LQALAEVCIRRPVFATMLVLAIVVIGAASLSRLGVDRLPSVDLPTVSVRTVLPGASPEEVETSVSQPIEEAVNAVDGIEELRSISGQGSSIIIATFALERDIDTAAQDVRDRVATVLRALPDDCDPPIVSKFDNDSSPVLTLALSGSRTIRELTEIADKLVKVQLERAQGVGEVRLVGELERTINVWLDSARLQALGLPVTAVRDAIAAQNVEVPGGNVTDPVHERVLRTMGKLRRPSEFAELVVATVGGVPIRVRDVAQVEDGYREQRSTTRLDGTPAVSLEIRRQSGANTIAVIDAVRAGIDRLLPQLPAGVRLQVIRDQSRFIGEALAEIERHLLIGALLASLVVLLFMRSWRSTLIASLAIPTSVIGAFGVMGALGFTLNSVTMLALVLMVGIVIDDAIVVIENVFRNIEEKGLPALEAARRGTAEIGLAVLATTLSLVVIFIPVSFMSSISGRLLYEFGITAAAAVLVSLIVSFTLTPALGARLLANERRHAPGDGAPRSRRGLQGLLDRGYGRLLRGSLRWRGATLLLAAGVVLASLPLYRAVRQDYLPSDVDEGEFQINVTGPQGASFAAMDRAMAAIEADVRAHPAVRTTMTSVGGSFLGQVSRGEVYVRLAPHEERVWSLGRMVGALFRGDPGAAFRGNVSQREVMQDLRRQLRKYPDLRSSVRNFASFNIGGGNFDIDIAIRGPELEALADYVERLRVAAQRLGGIVDADTTLKLDQPELRVEIDRDRAADLGVDARAIGTALRLLVGGEEEVSRYRDPATNEDYDVQLRLAAGQRDAEAQLATLLVPGRDGRVVELRNLARVRTEVTAARVDRLDRQRAANLRAGIGPGAALGDRLAALRAEVDALQMPPAYSYRVMGRGRELERTFREFLWAFGLSILLMYMILAAQYESLVDPIVILLALPVSVPFALLSLWLGDGTLNLYSALGILVLFGVVKKNAILQVDHIKQLRAAGVPRDRAILQGCADRLRPILMTTLALVGGMLPLVIGTGPGAEERRAVAIVVVGGQMLALLLTLLVTPAAYAAVDDLRARLVRRRAVPSAAAPEPAAQ
jgi:HAE1 family hydrophobic/amphiphilic exporter-1